MHRLSKASPAGQDGARTTSRSPSSPARRSACSATTAPASPRCCGSWPASIRTSAARPRSRRARRSACSSRSLSSTSQRTSAATCRTASPRPGAARPLQRARRQLLRRERRRVRATSRRRSKRPTPGASTRSWSTRWTRCACRRPTPTCRRSPAASAAASRCAACCSPARPAAARRADQPPRRRVGRLARAHLAEYRGAVVAVTHDRYFLDNVAGWILELDRGRGIPYQGNYSSWLEQKQARLAQEERSEKGRAAHDRRRARVGARPTPRANAPSQRPASPATRSSSPKSATSSSTRSRSTSRPVRAWAQVLIDADRPLQGLRRSPADRRLSLRPAARRASSA